MAGATAASSAIIDERFANTQFAKTVDFPGYSRACNPQIEPKKSRKPPAPYQSKPSRFWNGPSRASKKLPARYWNKFPKCIIIQSVTNHLSSLVLLAAVLTQAHMLAQAACPVPESGDLLLDKLPVIKAAIPRSGTNRFIVPTADEKSQWPPLIGFLLLGDTDSACRLIDANQFPYSVIVFSDTTTLRTYYLLQENIPVTKGWGTYIFDPTAGNTLILEIPHPLFDMLTPEQGIDAFQQFGATAVLIAGTHRYANTTPSSCQPTDTTSNSDVAHNIENMFQPAHERISAAMPDGMFVQLHGNGQSSCPDVFVSNGTTNPGPTVNRILDCLQGSGYVVEAATDMSACPLRGTTNVQGRFTNGSTDLCGQPADSATETWTHIEQSLPPRQERQTVINGLACALFF